MKIVLMVMALSALLILVAWATLSSDLSLGNQQYALIVGVIAVMVIAIPLFNKK